MRLGFIGTGVISSAVVRGLVGEGHQILISRRSVSRSAALSAEFPEVTVADNQTVVDQSDILFLGLMAESAPDVLSQLVFRPDQRVISFMAGMEFDQVAALVAPAVASAIMMPFPGIAVGSSPIMAAGDTDLVAEIFAPRNVVFALGNMRELNAYLCAQAVLSPVTRMVGDAAEWLGARVEDQTQGEVFLRMLVASSLSASECAPLIEDLNAPGGYNQRLRLYMEQAGMTGALSSGLDDLEG